MKNSLKVGSLILAIVISVSSCSSCGNGDKGGSNVKIDTPNAKIDTPKKTIDTAKTAVADTSKKK